MNEDSYIDYIRFTYNLNLAIKIKYFLKNKSNDNLNLSPQIKINAENNNIKIITDNNEFT